MTTSRLEAARAAHSTVLAKLNSINEEMRKVSEAAQPAVQALGTAASLRQQRTGIIARMLRLGRLNVSEAEVTDLDRQISIQQAREQQATAVLEARESVLADLQAQSNELTRQLPALRQELLEAQVEAAGAEITNSLMPAMRAAAEAAGASYGRLVGAGKAHCELVRQLRDQHGVMVQSLGSEYPVTAFELNPVGFGFMDGGGFNRLCIDTRPEVDAAHADFLRRWRAA